jgi:hypothetical protein
MKRESVKAIKNMIKAMDRMEYFTYEFNGYNIQLSQGCNYILNELKGSFIFNMIIKAQLDSIVKKHRIQIWRVEELKNKRGLTVYCTNGNRRLLFSEHCPYLEFDLKNFELYVIDKVAMLLPIEKNSPE